MKITLFTILLFISTLSFSKSLDSLINDFHTADIDKKYDLYYFIHPEIERNAVDSSKYFLDVLKKETLKLNRSDLSFLYKYYLAAYMQAKNLYGETDEIVEELVDHYTTESNDSMLCIVHLLSGVIQQKQGNLNKAEEQYLLALNYGQLCENRDFEILPYKNLGNVCIAQQRYNDAREALNIFIDYYSDKQNPTKLSSGYSLRGQIEQNEGNIDEALKHYQQSLELGLASGSLLAASNAYNNLAIIKYFSQEFDKSEQYFRLALSYREKIGNAYHTLKSYHNLGDFFFGTNQLDSAINYYNKTISLGEKWNDKIAQVDAIEQLAELYKSIGNYNQQSQHLERFIELNKLIFEEKNLKSLSILRMKYENDKESLLLGQSQREKVLKNQIADVQKAWSFWLILMAVVFIGIIISMIYNKKSKLQKPFEN